MPSPNKVYAVRNVKTGVLIGKSAGNPYYLRKGDATARSKRMLASGHSFEVVESVLNWEVSDAVTQTT